MNLVECLSAFYGKARADNRLSPTHTSLYVALLYEQASQDKNVLKLFPVLVMEKAKICSRVTYHKCMRELHDYGYIEYAPSFSPGASVVTMIELI